MAHEETTSALSSPSTARELVACWEGEVARFDLANGALVVGRGATCEVRLPHASVSRAHVRLEVTDAGVAVEDLGSANRARVDGVPVEGPTVVPIGSIVEVGRARLVVRTKGDGAGEAMEEVHRVLERVAPSQMSLVLFGETGVGKEVLTEQVHALSRRTGPLVRINCAGLAATLLESELFGYERGAFTGAVQAKPGLIEAAHGGTLFLDELGEMPAITQAKLLRVLESREVRRIGAVRAKPVDVRFVSATHRDLRTLAVMGAFREDLLFRLNGYTVRVPPLRERRTEVLVLARSFLDEACARAGRALPTFSAGAAALLESYRWPGNVRELRNAIDRVALLSDADRVLVDHVILDPTHVGPDARAAPPAPAPAPAAASGDRDRIVAELTKAGGNQVAAARALGVTPRVLAYRMDKLGIARPRKRDPGG